MIDTGSLEMDTVKVAARSIPRNMPGPYNRMW